MDTYNGTVVVCDDENAIRDYLTQALTLRGASVVGFDNGDKALEFFLSMQAGVGSPKIFVVDDQLIGSTITGLGIVGKVREVDKDSILILISGSDIADEVRVSAGMRVDAFLQKPFAGQQLMDAIKAALAKRSGSLVGDAVKSVTGGQMGGSWFTNRELAVYAINLIILITIVWFVARMDAQLTFLTRKIEIVEQNLNNESGTRSMSFNVLDGSIKEVKGALGQINKGK